jgi:cobalt/nickel transport system permease protein
MLYSPTLMHIPDGFLSTLVSVVFWIISIAVIAIALTRVSKELGEREVPIMGVLAAAIFAGQMLNFTVIGGTSGHLLGAALATILLGPWAAILTMTVVVTVQALIFQDGGILALGANIFNMAVIGVSVSFAVYKLFQKLGAGKRWAVFTGGFVAAWASIFVASLAAGLQLAFSGTSPANVAIPTMAAIHALIGIGEGLITLGAISFIYGVRRDLLRLEQPRRTNARGILLVGTMTALLLAIASPLASIHPDGLEAVAMKYGFIQKAQDSAFDLIPNYRLPFIHNTALTTIAAGILGVLIVLGVTLGFATHGRKAGKKS